jgi:ethanolamine utilization protein EutN
MRLGRVTGRLWSSIKNPELDSQRLLVVQPVTPEGEDTGKPLVCADCTGAGAGELIYWVRGREATFAFEGGEVPSDATIVGIVDEVHIGKRRGG